MYFVGYEMSRAIEEARGPEQIGTYFTGHPSVFFSDFAVLSPERRQMLQLFDGSGDQFV